MPLNGEVQSYCWSPDGKRIAYAWAEVLEGKPEDLADKEIESQVVVCEPDGKDARVIASKRGRLVTIPGMGHALPAAVVPRLAEEILAHTAKADAGP